MRVAVFVPVFAAAAFAQSSSSDDFPQTSYLQQTDSRGVVTGQPAAATSIPAQAPVDTSIPALETSVGVVATIPAVSPGVQTVPVQGTAGVNSTQTIIVSANNSTTLVLSTIGVAPSGGASGSGSESTPTGTGANPSASGGDSPSGSSSGSGAQSTGAAATMRAVAGSVVGMGAFVAAFL